MHPKAAQVASAPATTIEGIWQRHVSSRFADQALSGRRGYGRWGTLAERPKRYGDDELWAELPPDPRIRPRLRVVRDEGA